MRPPRFSIAGLMTTVLVASLGLAALRADNRLWAGLMTCVVQGFLSFAVVGAIYRRGADRAWWLGFFMFGWGFRRLAYLSKYPLPTYTFLVNIRAKIGFPNPLEVTNFYPYRGMSEEPPSVHIEESLWCLVAATLGAYLARAILAPAAARQAEEVVGTRPLHRIRPGGWGRLVAIHAIGCILIVTIALAGSRSRPALWGGAIFFLTWALLGLITLGAMFGRGRRRVNWAGSALFGVAYMLIIYGSMTWENGPFRSIGDAFVHSLEDRLPPLSLESFEDRESIIVANDRILRALDQKIPMRFPHGAPLSDVLDYVLAKAPCEDGHKIPIYVDPIAMAEAEATLSSKVQLDLEGVPVGATLRLALRQLSLTFFVKDGLLQVASFDDRDVPRTLDDFQRAYLIVGNCLIALVSALLGGLLAPLVAEPRRRKVTSPEAPRVQAEPEKAWSEA